MQMSIPIRTTALRRRSELSLEFNIDQSSILKWAKGAEEIGIETDPAIARALNAFGERVVEATAAQIEQETGQEDVRSLITVYQADAHNLAWEMDARAAMPSGTDWGREWTPDEDDRVFSQGQLLNVVTVGDESTCPICEEISEGVPYTVEEINNFSAKWAHYVPPSTVRGERTNLLHPNCRCSVKAWKSSRRVEVSMGPRSSSGTKMMTAEQVGRAIAGELAAVIRAKV
jgi:hypothetical protein